MYPRRVQLPRLLVDGARDRVAGEHVRAVRIRVAEEVGQCNGGEGVVVGVGGFVELHHIEGSKLRIVRGVLLRTVEGSWRGVVAMMMWS